MAHLKKRDGRLSKTLDSRTLSKCGDEPPTGSVQCIDCDSICGVFEERTDIILTVSGFPAPCGDTHNGTFTLSAVDELDCQWTTTVGFGWVLRCSGSSEWEIFSEGAQVACFPCFLDTCGETKHPTGSGTLTGTGLGDCDVSDTGSFTLV